MDGWSVYVLLRALLGDVSGRNHRARHRAVADPLFDLGRSVRTRNPAHAAARTRSRFYGKRKRHAAAGKGLLRSPLPVLPDPARVAPAIRATAELTAQAPAIPARVTAEPTVLAVSGSSRRER